MREYKVCMAVSRPCKLLRSSKPQGQGKVPSPSLGCNCPAPPVPWNLEPWAAPQRTLERRIAAGVVAAGKTLHLDAAGRGLFVPYRPTGVLLL